MPARQVNVQAGYLRYQNNRGSAIRPLAGFNKQVNLEPKPQVGYSNTAPTRRFASASCGLITRRRRRDGANSRAAVAGKRSLLSPAPGVLSTIVEAGARARRLALSACGLTIDLQIHHVQPRGRLGDDAEENLIILCARCHQGLHLHKQSTAISEEPD